MTRRLTDHERTVLIERVARELCWKTYGGKSFRENAEAVVDGLTRDGLTTGTLKRAINRVIEGGLASEGVA